MAALHVMRAVDTATGLVLLAAGQGHPVSAPTVARLLRGHGFSLQANAKTLEGRQHPDRDAQFRYINEQAKVSHAIPYGIYAVAADRGWVSVGTDHDTSAFAVASIRRWWQARGGSMYPVPSGC